VRTHEFYQEPGQIRRLAVSAHVSTWLLRAHLCPSKLIADENATATAHNIEASETLFRLGIASQLISHILFIFVALALYDLLKGVNQRHASLMVTWIVVSVPIAFLNELNAIAAFFSCAGLIFFPYSKSLSGSGYTVP
jgi:hypothetical protein